ncbi:acyltransferase family protein [Gottschalkia purinilytica]|uniref:Acyltransferase family protein n=1 Tax=Gottschalkia purinilytica TaxID=1503 RepID=A0A0L0WDP1_GOTPU|nr:acyltransferase family protein [Gottschalkia purinilytica]
MNKGAQQPWIKYSMKRIKRIYLPFIIISLIYGLYFFMVDGKGFTFLDVILGETAVHLYFIIHYMIFTLLAPFLYKIKYKLRYYCMWFMVFSNFAICLALEIQKSYGIKLITYNGINPGKWWGFLALGMIVAGRQNIFRYINNHRLKVILLSSLVTVIGTLLPFWTNTVGYMYNRSSLFPLAIGVTVLIIAIFEQREVPGKNTLASIGQKSFGIYLIHLFIIHFLKYILEIKVPLLVSIFTIIICLHILDIGKLLWSSLANLITGGKSKVIVVDYKENL